MECRGLEVVARWRWLEGWTREPWIDAHGPNFDSDKVIVARGMHRCDRAPARAERAPRPRARRDASHMGGGHQAHTTSGVRRVLRDFRSERSVRTALCNLRSILDLGTQRSTVILTGCRVLESPNSFLVYTHT